MEIQGLNEEIHRCTPSKKWKRYFDKANKLYFEGKLPDVKVYIAPLLKITQLSQKSALDTKSWKHAGDYAIAGYNSEQQPCIILDKGTSIFHHMLTKQSILHESIHFYIGLDHIEHDKKFKGQVRRIAALGALDDLI